MRGIRYGRRPHETPLVVTADDLAEECSAFLAGRWAARRVGPGGVVPSWAWLNRVAHADVTALRRAAARPTGRTPAGGDDVETSVARALLACTSPGDLPRVQREVLVPLELELMRAVASPRRVVELATSAIFR